ncbi:MAG: glycosyltransferase family 4 protein [Verrucomicrobia bacterium]|nr:glycosyltransferase family 4 protein [Verrucomicrobiota bacterium]
MRILLVTTDNREHRGLYDMPEPWLSSPIVSLLQGFEALGDEVEVHVASCSKRVMAAPEKLAPNIWFHQPVVPRLGWGRSLFLGCVGAVRSLAAELKVEVVHGQGTERECAMAAACSGKPAVITIHGHMGRIAEFTGAKFGSYYWMARKLERWTVGACNGVVCLSSYIRDRVKSGARRTWVVPNAVDVGFFTERVVPANGKRGLCVANISPWKNQVALIEACRDLVTSGMCELAFAGAMSNGHWYSAEFQRILEELPMIRHLGYLESGDIRKQMVESGFLVLPSLEENCPMALIEAMAGGVPVVASRVGGIPDLIRDGETGLLFDPRDPADIRRQVTRLAQDAELRGQLGAAAKDDADRRFHPKVVAQAHLDIYREVSAAADTRKKSAS